MKFPIKQILSKSKKKYQIIDADNKILIEDIKHMGFAMDICDVFNHLYTIRMDVNTLVNTKL